MTYLSESSSLLGHTTAAGCLTGQVIKRMMDVIQEIERQLLMVLLENIPEPAARPKRENESLLNGPQLDTSKAGVVASQDQVDDLLDSLGF